jgi:hypothetical protein
VVVQMAFRVLSIFLFPNLSVSVFHSLSHTHHTHTILAIFEGWIKDMKETILNIRSSKVKNN